MRSVMSSRDTVGDIYVPNPNESKSRKRHHCRIKRSSRPWVSDGHVDDDLQGNSNTDEKHAYAEEEDRTGSLKDNEGVTGTPPAVDLHSNP